MALLEPLRVLALGGESESAEESGVENRHVRFEVSCTTMCEKVAGSTKCTSMLYMMSVSWRPVKARNVSSFMARNMSVTGEAAGSTH